MTDKEVIETALAKCGMKGVSLDEYAKAVADNMAYWNDLCYREFGELTIQVFKGKYERSKTTLSNPKPPKD